MRRHRTGLSWAWSGEHMATTQFLHPGFRKVAQLAIERATFAAPHQRKAIERHNINVGSVLRNIGAWTRAGWRPRGVKQCGNGTWWRNEAVGLRQQCGDPRAERNNNGVRRFLVSLTLAQRRQSWLVRQAGGGDVRGPGGFRGA